MLGWCALIAHGCDDWLVAFPLEDCRVFPIERASLDPLSKLDGKRWVFPLNMRLQVLVVRHLSIECGLLKLAYNTPEVRDFGVPLIF